MDPTRLPYKVAWPIAGILFVVFWIVGEYGRMSFENNVGNEVAVISWIAVVAAFGVAIGLAATLPVLSGLIAFTVLLAQFFFEPARVTTNSWPVYFAFVLVIIGFSAHAPAAYRRTGLTVATASGALIAVMLALPVGPMPFWFFPELVTELMLVFLIPAAFIALALVTISWRIGRRLRPAKDERTEGTRADVELSILSDREKDIFLLAAEGMSNAEIAASAFISVATVKSHMTRIMSKLELSSRSQLVAFAWGRERVRMSAGIDSPDHSATSD